MTLFAIFEQGAGSRGDVSNISKWYCLGPKIQFNGLNLRKTRKNGRYNRGKLHLGFRGNSPVYGEIAGESSF